MEIVLNIDANGLTMTVDGQETPVASVDDAIKAIQQLAATAVGAAPVPGSAVPPAPEVEEAQQEQGMMEGYRGR